MRSDVPLGVCLSGGIDSTAIICDMARIRVDCKSQRSSPLIALSFNSSEHDESSYVRDTLAQTGALLKSLDADPQRLWDMMGKVLWHHDEPVHSMTAVVHYSLMALAADAGLTVVLSGQGADEVLAGYPSFFWNHWYTLLRRLRLKDLYAEVDGYAKAHNRAKGEILTRTLAKTLSTEMGRLGVYRRARRWIRGGSGSDPWYSTDLARHLPSEPSRPAGETLREALIYAVEQNSLPLYLRIEDRNSMAHSIEARLPFLDHRLVELAFSLGDEWKLSGPWNKHVLRQATRDRIPESVRTRVDKMGFPTPAKQWFRDSLHACIDELLVSTETRERGIYNIGAIRRDLERHKQGRIDVAGRLFDFAQFEMCMRLQKDLLPHAENLRSSASNRKGAPRFAG